MHRFAVIVAFCVAMVVVPSAGAASRSLVQSPTATGCASDATSPCAAAKALDYAHDIALSPNGQQLYAASYFNDGVVTFARNATTGALTQLAGTAGCVTATGRADAGAPATAASARTGAGCPA